MKTVEQEMIDVHGRAHVRLRYGRATVTLFQPTDAEIVDTKAALIRRYRASTSNTIRRGHSASTWDVADRYDSVAIKFKRITDIDAAILSPHFPHFPYRRDLRREMWVRGLFVEDVAYLTSNSVVNVLSAGWDHRYEQTATFVRSRPKLDEDPTRVCVLRVWLQRGGKTYGVPCMLYSLVDAPEDTWIDKAKTMLAVLNSVAERIE